MELDGLLQRWSKSDMGAGKPFVYEPDAYENNPLLAFVPEADGFQIQATLGTERQTAHLDAADVAAIVDQIHTEAARLLAAAKRARH